MYQLAKVQTCLTGLLGFRQNQNPKYGSLAADLVKSKSGLYFEDLHPLITLENIIAIAPNFADYKHENYNAETTYSKGARVNNLGTTMESQADANTGNALTEAGFWKPVDYVSNFLRETVNGSVASLVTELFTANKLAGGQRQIVEDLYLFSGGGNRNDLIIKEGRFVGLQITVKRKNDLAVVIQQLGAQFTQANEGLKFYLYQENRTTPLQVFTLGSTGLGGSFDWLELPEDLNIIDSLDGQTYYLGYYEDDLAGQAVSKEINLTAAPCGTCNQYNTDAYRTWSNYIEVAPFSVAPVDLNEDLALWSADAVKTSTVTNYGLNLRLTVSCDVTGFLCRNKTLLAKALGLQVAADLLAKMAFNVRVNGVAQEVKQAAFVELNNKNNNQPGITSQLAKSIKALNLDLSGFNSECLPCKEGDGVSWESF